MRLLYGINYIELDTDSIDNLMQELQMLCFGYSKKMVIVKNSGLFKKDTKKKTSGIKEIRDNLEKYLKENAEYVKERLVIIFIEDSIEKLNITKLIENLGGIICEFTEQSPILLEKRLTAICSAYKVNAENRCN